MNSPIGWIGGKKLLRNKIINEFPETYSTYVEVFGGAGWVLFAKDKHAEMEVYNDVNGKLVNLFRCIKYHSEELQKELEYMLASRELFEDSKQQLAMRGFTDIQRAARFLLVIKQSFGSKGGNFEKRPVNLKNTIEYMLVLSERLRKVTIDNLSYEKLIELYDKEDTLFYLDPPYVCKKVYEYDFKEEEHYKLKAKIDNIKGKFILSYNDCELIRDLYKDYHIIEVERQNNLTMSPTKRRYKELIIKNY